MRDYKYVIVGGGMSGDAAIKGIREIDGTNTIALIGNEAVPPYKRPPLTKGLWKGKRIDSVWLQTRDAGVDFFMGRSVVAYDAASRTVTDNTGDVYAYEKLLLATGGTPRRLPFADDGVIYFRALDDYFHLRMLTDRVEEFLIIGSGFIGSEIAAALAMTGKRVALAFPGGGIGGRLYPADLAEFLNGYYRDKGVRVLAREEVRSLERVGERTTATTSAGTKITADAVIAGLGIQPNVGLATAAGIAVENGIVVDDFLRTTNPDTYAAGDVANFFSEALGVRRRVEHEDNANTMGRFAGRNMAGAHEAYRYLPFFYSDLFELGYEAVGEMDARFDIVEDWVTPFQKGVLYYLQGGRVRGVLLWNTWGQVDAARALIQSGGVVTPDELRGRIHD
jgi:3-phenylpropionate/trans-cinnamate dioxygenase ferredoxin reductase subunit